MSLKPNIPIPSISDLTDNHARTLQQALAEAALASGVIGVAEANDLILSRSNVNVQSVVTAMGVHGLYRWLRDFIARQAIPIWARGLFLDGWLETYGMKRKAAIAASATDVVGSGVAGAILTAGSLMQTVGNVIYRSTADAIVDAGGVLTVSVIALEAGAAGNTGVVSTELKLIATVANINSTFNAPSGVTGGADEETDAQAVYRLVQRLSNEPRGGAPADYARWALAVPGITRAWGVRNPSGPTSAGVMIMADGNVDGVPTAVKISAVYDYIRDPKRGPPDELFVFAPTLKKISITLDMTPDTQAIRDAALLELKDLFFREAQPAYAMPHSHLIEAVSIATGEHTHQFISPALTSGGYSSAGEYELLVLGSVDFV